MVLVYVLYLQSGFDNLKKAAMKKIKVKDKCVLLKRTRTADLLLSGLRDFL